MTDKLRVFPGSGQRAEEITDQLSDQIKDLIYQTAAQHRITLAAAIGVLAIVQRELLDDHS